MPARPKLTFVTPKVTSSASRKPVTPPGREARQPRPATTPRLRPPAPERVESARPTTQPVPVVDLTEEPAPAPAPDAPEPAPGSSVFVEPEPAVEDETPAIVLEPDFAAPAPEAVGPEFHEPGFREPEPAAPDFPAEPTLARPVAPAAFEPEPAPIAAPAFAPEATPEAADEDLERLFWTESEALADLQAKGRSRSGRLLSRITGSHRKVG